MRRYLVLAAIVFCVSVCGAQSVRALSCMPPVLNDEEIERAAVIFEGRVTEAFRDRTKIALSHAKPPYAVFEVSKVWKGKDEGAAQYKIYGDATWGPFFNKDGEYLIVASERDGKFYAPLCGTSGALSGAGDKLEILKLREQLNDMTQSMTGEKE